MRLWLIFNVLLIILMLSNCKTSKQQPRNPGNVSPTVSISTDQGVDVLTIPLQIRKGERKIQKEEAIVIRDGGRIELDEGSELVINSKLIVQSNNPIFSGSGKVRFGAGAVDYVSPSWWGAKGDGTTDDYAAIQKAIDCAIYSPGVSRVLLPKGLYRLSKPLLAARIVKNKYQYFNLTLEGPQSTFDVSTGLGTTAVLIPDYSDNFVLGIQSCRGVVVKNIAFKGQNPINFSMKQVFEAPANQWHQKGVRDSRYSPHSAIAIDPFSSKVPDDGGFPGMSGDYLDGPGSSALKIINCKIANFVCGIVISPNGYSHQADNIRIDNCFIDYCKAGIGIGQSQSRALQVNGLAATRILYLFDARTYGAQQGVLPEVNVVCGNQIRWVFKCSSGFAYGHFKNMWLEELYGIGFSENPYGHMPMKFEQCSFNFNYPDPRSSRGDTKTNPAILQCFTASFDGCRIGYNTTQDKLAPLNFDVVSLNFDNCSLDQPIINSNLSKHQNLHNTRYNNIRFRFQESLQGVTSDGTIYHVQLADANQCVLVPGQGVTDADGIQYINRAKGMDFYQTERKVAIKVDEQELTASFRTSAPELYSVGDQLLINQPNAETGIGNGNTVRTAIGVVKKVELGKITIGAITYGLASGSYPIFVARVPYFKENTLGTLKKGSQVITNVLTESPLDKVWKKGDKINGKGIPQGAYVIKVDANKRELRISALAKENIAGTVLYDALLQKQMTSATLPNAGIWKKGDKVINDLSQNTNIYAWICTENGAFRKGKSPKFKSISF